LAEKFIIAIEEKLPHFLLLENYQARWPATPFLSPDNSPSRQRTGGTGFPACAKKHSAFSGFSV
jgi:hypothetical protein